LSFIEAVEVQAPFQPTTGQLAGSRCLVPTSLADLRRRGGRDVNDHRVLYHRVFAGADKGPAGFRVRRFRRKLARFRKVPIADGDLLDTAHRKSPQGVALSVVVHE
jgi:hypothetical protein